MRVFVVLAYQDTQCAIWRCFQQVLYSCFFLGGGVVCVCVCVFVCLCVCKEAIGANAYTEA
jgi:hypothetical protein